MSVVRTSSSLLFVDSTTGQTSLLYRFPQEVAGEVPAMGKTAADRGGTGRCGGE